MISSTKYGPFADCNELKICLELTSLKTLISGKCKRKVFLMLPPKTKPLTSGREKVWINVQIIRYNDEEESLKTWTD